jgi:hypothetical protein
MTRDIILPIITGIFVVAIVVVLTALFFGAQSNIMNRSSSNKELSAKASPSPLLPFFRLIQTIPIPNVNGRIDHLAIDIRGQKLFVAELKNNSLDIVDLKAARRIHSISNNGLLNEPQGVILVPELHRIFVSNGEDGTVDAFDAQSFSFLRKINFLPMMQTICVMMLTTNLSMSDTEKDHLV